MRMFREIKEVREIHHNDNNNSGEMNDIESWEKLMEEFSPDKFK
jgi:hypothetical protein